jgi:hypothetical protein
MTSSTPSGRRVNPAFLALSGQTNSSVEVWIACNGARRLGDRAGSDNAP